MLELEEARLLCEHDVLLRDREVLKHLKRGSAADKKLTGMAKRIVRSRNILDARRKQAISFSYPQTLPVVQALPVLTQSIEQHQVTIVCGGTGSGKSTQVPKLLLQMGFGLCGQIAHTQPRRIAARTVAARIATETHSKIGEAIGSQVRFDKTVSSTSRLKVMTDGILLEEIRHDRLLKNYDVVIIDEVHERSSNIDFALGYIAKILPERPELKVVLMSATVDNESLLGIFKANLVDIQGKQYPIRFDYRPFDPEQQSEAQAIDLALRELDDGQDVLVFLPGEREINDLHRYLQGRGFDNTEVLPLFGRLNSRAQAKVFEPHQNRRIILATNVAETSITIPGIRHVIDTGLARISRYNPRSKLLELPIAEISQAAAKQRAGRCGREAPGRCIRLYDEENYEQREPFTKPEILRTNLASSILRCESLKLGELASFPLPDKPPTKLISDGINLLKEISALDRRGEITSLGKKLSKLSADPRIARFLIAAAEVGQLDDALTIAAALTAGDCRVRPVDAREAADQAHQEFAHRDSDLLFFVNLWQGMTTAFESLSVRQKRKFCEERFLSWQRIQQWRDLRTQLSQQCHSLNLGADSGGPNYKSLHGAFVTAFASLIGAKNRDGDYAGARGITFKIHPRSTLIKRKPQFVVCLEMFETSARYAQIVAKIDAAWVQKAAPHLIKCSYSAPRWDARTGRAIAVETQRIFGIKLRSDKKVSYVSIDAACSRELFIEHALVYGESSRKIECVSHNSGYIKTLQNLEHKLRRSIAPDKDFLSEHYRGLIPDEVLTQKSFDRWLAQKPDIARQLKLAIDDELAALIASTADAYPDKVNIDHLEFEAKYIFDPANKADGMTLVVHEELLPRLNNESFDKLCPGLLEQKLTLMVKSLPKPNRKKISPLAEFVKGLVELAGAEFRNKFPNEFRGAGKEIKLNGLIERYYQHKTGETLEAGSLSNAKLPNYLHAHVKLVAQSVEIQRTEQNEISAQRQGKTASRFYRTLLEAKQQELGQHEQQSPSSAEDEVFTRWCFGDVEREVRWSLGANSIVDYQGLVDRNSGVSLGRFQQSSEADTVHLHGVARLASMASGIKSKTRAIAGFEQRDILLMSASLGLSAQDIGQLRKAAYAHALQSTDVPRTALTFDAFLKQTSPQVEKIAQGLTLSFAEFVAQAYKIKKKLTGDIGQRWPEPAKEMAQHLEELLNGEMLSFTSPAAMTSLPRYLTGIERRVDRLQLDPKKDKLKMLMLAEPLEIWRTLREQAGMQKSVLCELRYAIEEIFVNQFAPELSVSRRPALKQVMQQLKEQLRSDARGT